MARLRQFFVRYMQLIDILPIITQAGPGGISPGELAQRLPEVSRSTLNRRLAQLSASGEIRALGSGRVTRYASTSPLSMADIETYFATPWQQRPVARFEEKLLAAQPELDLERAERCTRIQGLAGPIDQKFLASFLIDFAWGSSVLEGGTYSALDTQALVEYGQRNKDKPVADAVLVLNHKLAAEYLWAHRELAVANLCAMHALLTDDHGLDAVRSSDHFLPPEQRGQVREDQDVNLGASAYLPPFRPGTGYVGQALERIIATASKVHPVQAALHLMTRIPYLQAFPNGNKRVSRMAADAALLGAGLLPVSFAHIDKASYIRGMSVFYELGSLAVIEQVFLRGYVRSIVLASHIPIRMRGAGFDVDAVVEALSGYVMTGKKPKGAVVDVFFG